MAERLGWIDFLAGPLARISVDVHKQARWEPRSDGTHCLRISHHALRQPIRPDWPARLGAVCDRLGVIAMTYYAETGIRTESEREAGRHLNLTPQATSAVICACETRLEKLRDMELQQQLMRTLGVSARLPRIHSAAKAVERTRLFPFALPDDVHH